MREDLTDPVCDSFIDSYRDAPVHSLRLNTARGADREILPFPVSADPVPWEPDGYCYEEDADPKPGLHPLHEAGAYYIQEASAMAPARLLLDGDGAPHRILDLCAAPGGKTVQLSLLAGDGSLLISNEIHPARAGILSRNAERMGLKNTIVTNNSPDELAVRFPAFFDRILVDAPCSGEGMFRKHPEAVTEWSEEAVELCAKRQSGILDAAADMLLPGGHLVYSTCTFAPAEDEEQIAAFLERHPDFSLQTQKKLFPHEVRGEGHYCALLIREGGVNIAWPPARIDTPADAALTRAAEAMLDNLLKDRSRIGYDPARLLLFGEQIFLVPPAAPALKGLRILRPGLQLAEIKRDRTGLRLLPAHALSHALRPEEVRFAAELSDEAALDYLTGQTFSSAAPGIRELPDLPEEDSGREVLLACRGFSLGWARYAGGMLKNRYPKGLRIMK
ncbi:MAG: RsmF rRNA methyltransferase first C-terminal domain-containing protein [Lachnospiraceae bacterium]|nr:RsmF rRNA methyltransferase first C-terminal domain-containing protein [Lachnospiraceae bacterium]